MTAVARIETALIKIEHTLAVYAAVREFAAKGWNHDA